MRHLKSLLALTLIFGTLSASAQDSGDFSALMQGPNFALALAAIVQIIAIVACVGILRTLTSNTAYFAKFRKMVNENGGKAGLLLLFMLGSTSGVFAQSEARQYPELLRDENFIMLAVLNLVLLGVFIYLVSLIRSTIALLMPPLPEAEKAIGKAAEKEENTVMHALTDAVPVEREHEVMMDHEYDGIRELDNNLPPWWLWMFYATIFFAFVYMIWYHVLPFSQDQHEQYAAELMQAEEDKAAYIAKRGEMVDETNVEFLADAADLKAGRAIFNEHCQACHAKDGGGGVGPNLTDDYWIHGGSIKDIFGVVKYGVPTKGMIAWQNQLRPKEIAQVSSFIKTLAGTEPAAPKEPQGELWVPEDDAAPADEKKPEENDKPGDTEEPEVEGTETAAAALLQ